MILAFDIERSGDRKGCSTIAIGACLVTDGKVVEKKLWKGYTKDTVFEERCINEFWKNHKETLRTFFVEGKTVEEAESSMIKGFQDFRKQAEEKYSPENIVLVSDNPCYDGRHMNNMIEKYTDDLPMPHAVTTKKYGRMWDSDSLCRGVIRGYLPEYSAVWGVDSDLRKLLGKDKTKDSHSPDDDAEDIALTAYYALNM